MNLPTYTIQASRIESIFKNEMTDGYTLTLSDQSKVKVAHTFRASPGDWFLKSPSGKHAWVSNEIFQRLFT